MKTETSNMEYVVDLGDSIEKGLENRLVRDIKQLRPGIRTGINF